MRSNRFNNLPPVEVKQATTSGYVICPFCNRDAFKNEDEIGYHGKNGGAYLCEGSGRLIVPSAYDESVKAASLRLPQLNRALSSENLEWARELYRGEIAAIERMIQ